MVSLDLPLQTTLYHHNEHACHGPYESEQWHEDKSDKKIPLPFERPDVEGHPNGLSKHERQHRTAESTEYGAQEEAETAPRPRLHGSLGPRRVGNASRAVKNGPQEAHKCYRLKKMPDHAEDSESGL
jgi:hypothetical protein